MGHHLIRIFMSSPSDVRTERDTVSNLVEEINDMLEYLGPKDKPLRLQLLRYETDTYPDYGQPQEVVNRQMPNDYHIFVGVMWARCGTPTGSADSGTIEEFERARERRQQSTLPKLMFYFCDQPISIPGLDGVRQLEKVVSFREELASQGLTARYATHAEFREVVRGHLLHAIHDILYNEECLEQIGEASATAAVSESDRRAMLALSAEYEKIRQEMPVGGERTQRMTAVASKMTARAASVRSMLRELQDSTWAGERLAAIAILQMFPEAEALGWLAERLDPDLERLFIGYQASVALLQAVRGLPSGACRALDEAINTAMRLAEKVTDDKPRLDVLKSAQKELQRKCPDGASRPP